MRGIPRWMHVLVARIDDGGSEISVVGSPLRMSATPTKVGGSVPELGQHTEEVLLEIGYSWDEIEQLRTDGAL